MRCYGTDTRKTDIRIDAYDKSKIRKENSSNFILPVLHCNGGYPYRFSGTADGGVWPADRHRMRCTYFCSHFSSLQSNRETEDRRTNGAALAAADSCISGCCRCSVCNGPPFIAYVFLVRRDRPSAGACGNQSVCSGRSHRYYSYQLLCVNRSKIHLEKRELQNWIPKRYSIIR